MPKRIVAGILYLHPPEQRDDVRDVPASVLREMSKNMFALKDGKPCPIRLNHLPFNRSLGKVIGAMHLKDGTPLIKVEFNDNDPRVDALFKEAGEEQLWCFSLGHILEEYADGREEYTVKDISITGLGGRDHTIVLNDDSIKRLFDTAKRMGIDTNAPLDSNQEQAKETQELSSPPPNEEETKDATNEEDMTISDSEHETQPHKSYFQTPFVPVEKVREITIQASRYLYELGDFNSFSELLHPMSSSANNTSAGKNDGGAANNKGAAASANNNNNNNNNNGSNSGGNQNNNNKASSAQANNTAGSAAGAQMNNGQGAGMPNMGSAPYPYQFYPTAWPQPYPMNPMGVPYGFPPMQPYGFNPVQGSMPNMPPGTNFAPPQSQYPNQPIPNVLPPGASIPKPEDLIINNMLEMVNKSKELTDRLAKIFTQQGDIPNGAASTGANANQQQAQGDTAMGNTGAAAAATEKPDSNEFLEDLKVCFKRELESGTIAPEEYNKSVDFIEQHLTKDSAEFSRVIQFLAAHIPSLGATGNNNNNSNNNNGIPNGMGMNPGFGFANPYGNNNGFMSNPMQITEVSASSGEFGRAQPQPTGPMNPFVTPFNPMGPIGVVNQTDMTTQALSNIQQSMAMKDQGTGFVGAPNFKPDANIGLPNSNGVIPMPPNFAWQTMYDQLKSVPPNQMQQWMQQQQQALRQLQQQQQQQQQQRGMLPGYGQFGNQAMPNQGQFGFGNQAMPNQGQFGYGNQAMPNQTQGAMSGQQEAQPISFYVNAAGRLCRSDNHQYVSQQELAAMTTNPQSRRFDSNVVRGLQSGSSNVPVEKRGKGESGTHANSGTFDPSKPLPLLTQVLASKGTYDDDPLLKETLDFYDRNLQTYFKRSPEAKQMMEERFGPRPDAAYVFKAMKETSEKQEKMFDNIVKTLTDPNKGWPAYTKNLSYVLNVSEGDLNQGQSELFESDFTAPKKGQRITVNASKTLFGKSKFGWIAQANRY